MADFDVSSDELRGDPFELVVNGESFSGWESMSLSRSIEQAAGTFLVRVSGRRSFPISKGDQVEVRVADELVMTGFVDVLDAMSNGQDRTLSIAGRDRTADLVDCSEVSVPGEWSGLTLEELVEQLAKPFGIDVVNNLPEDLAPFEIFKIQPGEYVWTAIERAVRLRGVLAFPDELGRVVLERAGTTRADGMLLEDRSVGNILSSRIRSTDAERFQVYTVRGQRRGSDDGWGETPSAQIEGTAEDPNIGRFRPLLIQAEGQVTFENATDRAQWEATVRAARAFKVTIEAQGWRQTLDRGERGKVWRVNQLVPIRIPTLQFSAELLLESLNFTRDPNAGSLTRLVFVRPDAYLPQPEIPPNEAEDFIADPDLLDFRALGISLDD